MSAPLVHVGGILTTPRLALEPLMAAHAPRMQEGFADPALYRWIDVEPPAGPADLRTRFERIANPYAPTGELWLNWAVRAIDGGAYAGLVEATVRRDRVVYLAWYVFTAFARRGIAREACRAVIAYVAKCYDAVEFRADMDYRNVPARYLAESLGFVRRAHTRRATLRGEPTVEFRYRLKPPFS